MKKIFPLLLSLFIVSCSPPVARLTQDASPQPAFPQTAGFGVVAADEVFTADETAIYVSDIEIKDGGVTFKCTYDEVITTARKKGLSIGANLLVIKEHKLPDWSSTCHRIKGSLYRIPNPEKYEVSIVWSEERPLTIANFQANPEARPSQAATATNIVWSITAPTRLSKYRLRVQAIFYPRNSYFKRGSTEAEVLAHEQIHFDISELYARKFRKLATETVFTKTTVGVALNKAYSDLVVEWQAEQDRFDSIVYPRPDLFSDYAKTIAEQLEALASFKDKGDIILQFS